MIIKLTIEVDTDQRVLTDEGLRNIQGAMYQCCHTLEEMRYGLVGCKPLDVDNIKWKDPKGY